MKNIEKLKYLLYLTIFLLSACVHPIYDAADQNVMDARMQVATAKSDHSTLKSPGGKFSMYRRGQRYLHNASPRWLRRSIDINAEGVSFEFIVDKLMRGTHVTVSYDPNVNREKTLSLHYSGSIKGALEALQAKTGYGYIIDNRTLTWSFFVSKTFDISFMPGASTYLLGKQASLVKGGGGYGTNVILSPNNQYSNLRGRLSVWDDLRRTLMQLKSKEGKVYVSQATTTVTVYDHPAQMRRIARYIRQLNQRLSRQVALQVHVLEIDLKRGFNYGINWQLVRKVMDVQLGLQGALDRPVSLVPLGDNSTAGRAGFIIQAMKGPWKDTDLLINALSQQGKVSTITRPRVVTLNNQVAEIDINTQTGYLREVTSTTQGTSATTTTSLTPGTIKTGFTLYLLPKIQRNDVYLQISSTISSLLGITTITANPNERARDNTQIQLPTVTEKRFNQRTLIPSNATLVLAGFKQLRNEANKAKMFGSSVLGGRGAKQNNSETIVLITPTIVNRR